MNRLTSEAAERPGGAGKELWPMKTLAAPTTSGLSRRQEEILLAACIGAPDKAIAEQLGISPRTLEGHWRAIHRKLGSVNRFQAGFIFAALRENPQGKAVA